MTRATTVDIRGLADALSGAFPPLDATDQRIAIAIYRLLARGHAASAAEAAAAVNVTPTEVTKRMDVWRALFRDDEGRVVGFWGLTVNEMPPHELLANDVKLWAWCAWDTLFLPARLGAIVQVRSVCPVTRKTVGLQITPDRIESVVPDGVVVSFLNPDQRFDGDVITSFCHFIHFFASPQAGQHWIEHHPGTFLLSLSEAFELAQLSNKTLLGIP